MQVKYPTFAGELSVVLAARLVVADDADEVLVDLALALAVGGRRLLMLQEGRDEYAMNEFKIPVKAGWDSSMMGACTYDICTVGEGWGCPISDQRD